MNDISVLMMTCEKYKQLWDPFFILFKKYWADCPYEIFMGTDFGEYPGIKTIKIGSNWTNNLLETLKQIKSKRIILFLDDYLAYKKFDNELIKKLSLYSIQNDNVACIRLMPCPGPDEKYEKYPELGIIKKGANYRFSLQVAIWNKEFLLNFADPKETPWQLEINGTKRTNLYSELFLSVFRQSEDIPGGPTPYTVTAVSKGVWENSALELLKKENICMKNITKIIK